MKYLKIVPHLYGWTFYSWVCTQGMDASWMNVEELVLRGPETLRAQGTGALICVAHMWWALLPGNESCAAPAAVPTLRILEPRQCDSSLRKVTLSVSSLWFSNAVWSKCNFSPALWKILPVKLYVMKTSAWEAIFNFCSEVGHPAVSRLLLHCLVCFFLFFLWILFFLLWDSLFVQADLSLMVSSSLPASASQAGTSEGPHTRLLFLC